MSAPVVDRQSWATPRALFDALSERYGPFDLDVSAEAWNAKCERYLTKEDDALAYATSWWVPGTTERCKVWCNPPYADLERWVGKAIDEFDRGFIQRLVMLLPSRTDRKWFHRLLLHPRVHIEFLPMRVRFEPPPGVKPSSPREASIVAVFEAQS